MLGSRHQIASPLPVWIFAPFNAWCKFFLNFRRTRRPPRVLLRSPATKNHSLDGCKPSLSPPCNKSASALWVYDGNNNRVTRFDDANTTAIQPPANAVLGQPNLVSAAPGLTANSFDLGFGPNLFIDPLGNVWVADNDNNRVLRFTRPVPPTPPAVDTDRPEIKVRGRKTIETLRKRIVIRGTASDASGIEEITVKTTDGASLKRLRGTTRWKAILRVTKDTGRIVVKFRSVDPTGNRSRVSRVRILRR